jgi:hypothetical protein
MCALLVYNAALYPRRAQISSASQQKPEVTVSQLVCSSTALAFLTNMSKKYKCASPNAIQVKNKGKTIGIEQKLHIISQCEKGE